MSDLPDPSDGPGSRDAGVWPLFLKDIRRTRVLGREEEVRLLGLALQGDRAARDVLVVSNLRFVLQMAMRYRNPSMPLADLVNEGCIGLMRAVESFEPHRGVRFLSYAVWWIRASMAGALDRSGSLVRVPGLRSGRGAPRPCLVPFEDGELAAPASGDGGEDGSGWRERMPGRLYASRGREDGMAPVSAELLSLLPAREALVLRWLYRLDHRPARSLRQLADILGMSHQRVRQLRDQAFRRLREGETWARDPE